MVPGGGRGLTRPPLQGGRLFRPLVQLPAQPQAKARRGDAEARTRLHVHRAGLHVDRPRGVVGVPHVAMMTVTVMARMESVVAVTMTVARPMGDMVVVAVTMTMAVAVAVTVGSGVSLGGGEGQANDGDGGQQKTLYGVSPRFSFFWVGGPASCRQEREPLKATAVPSRRTRLRGNA